MDAEHVAKALGAQRRSGDGWTARCPAHEDKQASLSINDKDGGGLLVRCQAGCAQRDVIEALRKRDLWPEPPTRTTKREIVATYDYRRADGSLVYQVVRFAPKDFRQRRPDPDKPDGWIWSIKGVQPVPYRLPELIATDKAQPVWIVEGEKDADRLAREGFVATTAAMGAGKWRDDLNAHFGGRHVVIAPDNDAPGRKHAEQVAAKLATVAASVRVVRLDGAPEKGDVSDVLQAGKTANDLQRLAAETPIWSAAFSDAVTSAAEIAFPGVVDPLSWCDRPPPPRRWIVDHWIPHGQVTLLTADGGTGKSLVAQQLATAVGTGTSWLGLPTTKLRVGVVSCEDDGDELHRRQVDVNQAMGVEMEDLEDVLYWPRTADDSILAHYDASNEAETTDFYGLLTSWCKAKGVQLLIIDTAADVFGGNENIRGQVNHFLKAVLGRIAREIDGGVVLLAHPSNAGLANKTGLSGSTGWSNAVRSRLYMTREDDGDGLPSDIRVISKVKANYASTGDVIRIEWRSGAFHALEQPTGVFKSIHKRSVDDAFLECLDVLTGEGQSVSASPNASNYAPKIMAGRAPVKGYREPELAAAMKRHFDGRRIHLVEDKKRRSKHIARRTAEAADQKND